MNYKTTLGLWKKIWNEFVLKRKSNLKEFFRSGKKLAGPFIQLPSRREYPDYYEQIERPMDLNRIRKKIDDDKYTSLAQMSADVDLLCDNAQV